MQHRARISISIAIILIIGLFLFLFLSTTGAFYFKMISAVAATEKDDSVCPGSNKTSTHYKRWLLETKRTLGTMFKYNIESHEDECITDTLIMNTRSPVIYVINHPLLKFTLFDNIALCHLKRDHSITLLKHHYDMFPIARQALDGSDPILLRATNGTMALSQQYRFFRDACEKRFDSGQSVALFPERHAYGSNPFVLRELRSGAFRTSAELGVPVVYVVADPSVGTELCMETTIFNLYVSRPYYATEFTNVDEFRKSIAHKMQMKLSDFNRNNSTLYK